MNGKVNAVTLGLANLYAKKQVEIAVTDLTTKINSKSKPIPFVLNGSNLRCGIPFSEALIYCTQGTNQVNATLFTNSFNSQTMLLDAQNAFAYFVQYATNMLTDEYVWIRVGFKMLDGTILKLQFNPDESVTRINDETTGIAATQSYVQNAIAPVQEDVTALESDVGALENGKVSLPVTNSAPNYGTAGQFAVSDGNGGITWKTLYEAEGVDY